MFCWQQHNPKCYAVPLTLYFQYLFLSLNMSQNKTIHLSLAQSIILILSVKTGNSVGLLYMFPHVYLQQKQTFQIEIFKIKNVPYTPAVSHLKVKYKYKKQKVTKGKVLDYTDIDITQIWNWHRPPSAGSGGNDMLVNTSFHFQLTGMLAYWVQFWIIAFSLPYMTRKIHRALQQYKKQSKLWV